MGNSIPITLPLLHIYIIILPVGRDEVETWETIFVCFRNPLFKSLLKLLCLKIWFDDLGVHCLVKSFALLTQIIRCTFFFKLENISVFTHPSIHSSTHYCVIAIVHPQLEYQLHEEGNLVLFRTPRMTYTQ